MALSVNSYYGGSWVDISDYVVGAGEVPYVSRNRDWTLRLEIWDVEIAGTLRDIRGASYNFSAGDKFTVKDGTTFLFMGVVLSSEFDNERQVFNVSIENALTYLNDYQCKYSVVHSQLSVGRANWYEYVSYDISGNALIGITWLLEKLFSIAGLTLNTTTVGASVLFNDATVGYGDILVREMLVDEDMFYCVNQNLASINTNVVIPSIPTFFEYISAICSVFGFCFQPTGADGSGNFTFTLVHETANYTIADDDKYEYQEIVKDSQYKTNYSGCDYAYDSNRAHYRSVTIYSLTEYTTGGWDHKVDYLKNLFFFYTDVPVRETAKSIGNAVHSGGTVTVTSPGHGYSGSDSLLIENVAGMTDLNGFHIIASVIDSATYTITLTTTQTYTSGGESYKLTLYNQRNLTPDYQSTHQANTWNPIYYKMLSEIGDNASNIYTSEEITAPYQTGFNTVVENFIDLENRTSKIIQETY